MKIFKYRKHKYYNTYKFIKMSYPNSKIYMNNKIVRLISMSPYFDQYHLIIFDKYKVVFFLNIKKLLQITKNEYKL